jgi:hypothetical protein
MGLFVFAVVAFFALLVGCWFLYAGFVKKLTADQPAEVTMTMPSDAEFQAADAKLTQLKTAMRSNQQTTVALTATDLNALIARHQDFHSGKNRVRVSIADSLATLQMSVPLKSVSWPGFKSRWFNGSMQMGFGYDAETGFDFNPRWIEANGHQLNSHTFLRSFSSSFNRSFTVSFEEELKKEDAQEGWSRIKSIALQDDKLVITTMGPPGT